MGLDTTCNRSKAWKDYQSGCWLTKSGWQISIQWLTMLRLPTCGGFCLLKVSYAHHDSPSLWDFNSRRNCFSQYYYNISQYLILSKLSFYCVLDIETHRSGDKMQDFLILGPRKISFNYSTRAFFPMKVCHPLPVVFFKGCHFKRWRMPYLSDFQRLYVWNSSACPTFHLPSKVTDLQSFSSDRLY